MMTDRELQRAKEMACAMAVDYQDDDRVYELARLLEQVVEEYSNVLETAVTPETFENL